MGKRMESCGLFFSYRFGFKWGALDVLLCRGEPFMSHRRKNAA